MKQAFRDGRGWTNLKFFNRKWNAKLSLSSIFPSYSYELESRSITAISSFTFQLQTSSLFIFAEAVQNAGLALEFAHPDRERGIAR